MPVVGQPVLGPHIREKAGEFFRKKGLPVADLLVGERGKGFQLTGIGKQICISGQKVVIYDVDDGACIETVILSEENFCLSCNGVTVGVTVDGPVESDTVSNGFGEVQFFFPFHKITDQVAYGDVGYAEGQVCMCQIIHVYKVRFFGRKDRTGILATVGGPVGQEPLKAVRP